MYSVVVIGGGLMGCSAAWQLARTGERIVLLEKQSGEYSNGSSYGEARVTRSLGVKDDLFTYVKEVCVEEVKLLIEELNKLDQEIHKFSDVYTETPVTYLYDSNKRDEVESLVMNSDYEIAWNEEEARTKFGLEIKDKIVIREFKQGSGTINPKELIRKLKRGIQLYGGEIKQGAEVLEIEENTNEISLHLKSSSDEIIKSKGLVLATGPYNPKLLNGLTSELDDRFHLKRLYLTFFQLSANYWNSLSRKDQERFVGFYPVADFNDEVYYSMIEKFVDGTPLIKVGGHMKRFEIPDKKDIWKDTIPKSEIDWSRESTLNYLDALGFDVTENELEYNGGYSCVYTLTSDEVPILTSLKINSNIVVVAGLSGVGAKGSLAYGKIAADYFYSGLINDDFGKKVKRDLMI